MCNRATPGVAKDQLGFVAFAVKPTFAALVGFLADRSAALHALAAAAAAADNKSSAAEADRRTAEADTEAAEATAEGRAAAGASFDTAAAAAAAMESGPDGGALFVRRPSALAALEGSVGAPPSAPTPGMLALVDALDAKIDFWQGVAAALGPDEHAALRLPSDLPPQFRPDGFPNGYYSGAVYIDEYDSQL
jgi:hypothetical protein